MTTRNNADPQKDYDGYTKSLEKIYEGAIKDYWTSYVDINRHQVNVGKTYLWVAVALIGLYIAALDKYGAVIISKSCLIVVGGMAFTLSCFALGICLYAIPARKGYKPIPEKGWGEFSHEVYQHIKNNDQHIYAKFLTSHIGRIDHAWAHNFKTNLSRALLLRITSWLLIVSFILAMFVSSVVVIEKVIIQPKPTGKITMANESNESQVDSTPSPRPDTSTTVDVPEPPPTADISGGTYSTHSAPPPARTFITEGNNKNK